MVMSELFSPILSLPTPFNMIVLMTLIIFGAGVITTGFKQWRKVVCHRQEIEFKRELVERGLTVEEIERIIRARGDSAAEA